MQRQPEPLPSWSLLDSVLRGVDPPAELWQGISRLMCETHGPVHLNGVPRMAWIDGILKPGRPAKLRIAALLVVLNREPPVQRMFRWTLSSETDRLRFDRFLPFLSHATLALLNGNWTPRESASHVVRYVNWCRAVWIYHDDATLDHWQHLVDESKSATHRSTATATVDGDDDDTLDNVIGEFGDRGSSDEGGETMDDME